VNKATRIGKSIIREKNQSLVPIESFRTYIKRAEKTAIINMHMIINTDLILRLNCFIFIMLHKFSYQGEGD